jgi:guanylate kinase
MGTNKTLYLLVGKSASGKTTIANFLEKMYGHKQVNSYTTRMPRYYGEIGHMFISNSEFDQLGELAAFTTYNGHRYGVTYEQLAQCDIYVIDIPGVESLLKNLHGSRPICIIYFDAAVSTRIDRMIDRHASDMEIVSRLRNDDTTEDWYRQLEKLVWHYKNIKQHDIELHKIDANENIENVLKQVLYYINNNEVE